MTDFIPNNFTSSLSQWNFYDDIILSVSNVSFCIGVNVNSLQVNLYLSNSFVLNSYFGEFNNKTNNFLDYFKLILCWYTDGKWKFQVQITSSNEKYNSPTILIQPTHPLTGNNSYSTLCWAHLTYPHHHFSLITQLSSL